MVKVIVRMVRWMVVMVRMVKAVVRVKIKEH